MPEGVYAGCAGVCKDYFERSWTVVKNMGWYDMYSNDMRLLTALRNCSLRYRMSFMQIILNLHMAFLCLPRLQLMSRISF